MEMKARLGLQSIEEWQHIESVGRVLSCCFQSVEVARELPGRGLKISIVKGQEDQQPLHLRISNLLIKFYVKNTRRERIESNFDVKTKNNYDFDTTVVAPSSGPIKFPSLCLRVWLGVVVWHARSWPKVLRGHYANPSIAPCSIKKEP
ncbi:dihydrolipoyl dehydrogenase [Striga asiatica]|uniref:Dihydrolipoyl dehydrogenase n=1 Tax=Striga asiatica TaxID=4170 RepID=A0A5A7QH96_STRAF|nr:dihydrolipoyl dehydrogenase [Striga asiatica]